MTAIQGVADFNGDNHVDLMARDASGVLWLYPVNGSGGLGTRVQVGGGWQGYSVVAVGDINKDGTEDLLARDPSGVLWLYPGNGSGSFLARVEVGGGWQSYAIAGDGSTLASTP